MCLAQGHNAVKPVRLKSAASLSQVNYSTTEPLHTLCLINIYIGMPGIPYVLGYVKNILNIRYARNTLSTIQ